MKSDWKFRPLLNLIDFLNWKELNFIILTEVLQVLNLVFASIKIWRALIKFENLMCLISFALIVTKHPLISR